MLCTAPKSMYFILQIQYLHFSKPKAAKFENEDIIPEKQ